MNFTPRPNCAWKCPVVVPHRIRSVSYTHLSQTDILRPLSQTFGIGRYYDDVNPEFMDAFEVALLVGQAEEQATAQAIAAAKEKAEHDRIAEIGAQRLRRIMPEGVQGVIIAELNETEYTCLLYTSLTAMLVTVWLLSSRRNTSCRMFLSRP